jgi:hypothetical protein
VKLGGVSWRERRDLRYVAYGLEREQVGQPGRGVAWNSRRTREFEVSRFVFPTQRDSVGRARLLQDRGPERRMHAASEKGCTLTLLLFEARALSRAREDALLWCTRDAYSSGNNLGLVGAGALVQVDELCWAACGYSPFSHFARQGPVRMW